MSTLEMFQDFFFFKNYLTKVVLPYLSGRHLETKENVKTSPKKIFIQVTLFTQRHVIEVKVQIDKMLLGRLN